MRIIRRAEHALDTTTRGAITRLRNACFPDHAVDRSYYKQLPHFRLLVYEETELVGHLGVDHRVVSVSGTALSIFGIIDLCVASGFRRQGLAGKLLENTVSLASKSGIEALLLFANDDRLYRRHGFRAVSTEVTSLRIDGHTSHGAATERIDGALMFRPVHARDWPGGPVDLLGYLF